MRGLIRMLMRVALPKLIGMLPALLALFRNKGVRQSDSARSRPPESHQDNSQSQSARSERNKRAPSGSIDEAFARGQSDIVLTDTGTVITELPDDNVGDRHQRILVELDSGLTLLIAHNIDLARRVGGVRRGEQIRFKGEYEFTEKGGVMHWTHHDPKGWHDDGWIEYDGEVYG